MDSRKVVLKQTAAIAVGECICSSLMLVVYAVLGSFHVRVLLSAIGGSVIMIMNHFVMSLTVCRAADCAESGDLDGANKSIQLSSTLRLICMGIALFVGIRIGADVIALVLPLAFARPILMVCELFGKKVSNGRD